MSEPRFRLLLVEDDDPVREILWESLEHAGLAVDTAQTTTEALRKLATRGCAAIVTDCVLADLPPLDWLAAVRGAARETPLVLYSRTVASDDLKLLARPWGAAAVLEKRGTLGARRGDEAVGARPPSYVFRGVLGCGEPRTPLVCPCRERRRAPRRHHGYSR